jgi:hypothetical protein
MNTNLPTFTTTRPPRHRKRKAIGPATPPAALTLLEAQFTFVGPGATLRLEFGRAIDIAGFDPAQLTVQDPTGTGWAYGGTGVVDTPDAQTVVVEMAQTVEAIGTLDTLTATPANGIVAVDDAAAWAGVSNLGLPFP